MVGKKYINQSKILFSQIDTKRFLRYFCLQAENEGEILKADASLNYKLLQTLK